MQQRGDMSRKPIVPDYVAVGTDLAPRDRWSWSAIASLVFSLVSSPVIFWRILAIGAIRDSLRWDIGQFSADALLGMIAPILSMIFATAASIRSARSEHLRGIAFTIPAIIIGLPGFVLMSLLLYAALAGIELGPR